MLSREARDGQTSPRLGMSDAGCPLPQALAGPPVTHTFSPQSTKYIFKKPQHNQASREGPGEARVWPTVGQGQGPGVILRGAGGWGSYCESLHLSPLSAVVS